MKTTKKNMQQIKKTKMIKTIGLIGILAIAASIILLQMTDEKTANETDTQTKTATNLDVNTTTEASEIEAVTGKGVLKILKEDLTDQAKFYPYEVKGIKMEVLAFKASDGTVRTALNTCQVCYDSGRGYYVQEGDKLICQNCGNQFAADQVELIKGGCNPVPIMKENKIEDETTITIDEAFLAENIGLFASWKK